MKLFNTIKLGLNMHIQNKHMPVMGTLHLWAVWLGQ